VLVSPAKDSELDAQSKMARTDAMCNEQNTYRSSLGGGEGLQDVCVTHLAICHVGGVTYFL
jgi:hypothetical protein